MKKNYPKKAIFSFIIVLLTMPLGHALMILMEHFMSDTVLHFSAFFMGLAGLLIVIAGVFVKGNTKQTIFGLGGGLLFWTGWVEFLFAYYAARYGVQCDLTGSGIVETATTYINGVGVEHTSLINGMDISEYTRAELKEIRGSRPEYLILPATFGMWMMFMVLYLFCARTGCNFLNWMQKKLGIIDRVELRPMANHASIVTFIELNLMLWALYLLLMFCYDPVFLGSSHPVTYFVAAACLIGSIFMFRKMLHIPSWGRNIRMAIATVIVFWTFVEVVARNGLLRELWVDPLNNIGFMTVILVAFIVLPAILFVRSRKSNE